MLTAVNLTLIKGLVALAPACVLLAGSIIMFLRAKTAPSLLQLVGAGGLVVVIFTHVFEALDLFAWIVVRPARAFQLAPSDVRATRRYGNWRPPLNADHVK